MSLLPDELYEKPQQKPVRRKSNIGALLRKTRESYDVSLQDVSDYLNIRQGILRAIEEGNKDELPEQVYTIGFLKSYATYLNLDVDKIVKQYKLETGITQKKVRLDVPVTAQESHLPDRKIMIIAVVAIIVLVALIALFVGDDKQQQVNQTPEVEVELDVSNLEIEPLPVGTTLSPSTDKMAVQPTLAPTTITPIEEPTPQPFVKGKSVNEQIVEANNSNKLEPSNRATIYGAANVDARVVLKAISNSWVEIKNEKGRILLSRVLKPDDIFYVPNQGGAFLTTGNAGGLEIYVDQTYAGVAGDTAEVLKNYKITPQGLIKQ